MRLQALAIHLERCFSKISKMATNSSGSDGLMKMTELRLDNAETSQKYTILVPEELNRRCCNGKESILLSYSKRSVVLSDDHGSRHWFSWVFDMIRGKNSFSNCYLWIMRES